MLLGLIYLLLLLLLLYSCQRKSFSGRFSLHSRTTRPGTTGCNKIWDIGSYSLQNRQIFTSVLFICVTSYVRQLKVRICLGGLELYHFEYYQQDWGHPAEVSAPLPPQEHYAYAYASDNLSLHFLRKGLHNLLRSKFIVASDPDLLFSKMFIFLFPLAML
jgi:hypothetical protein